MTYTITVDSLGRQPRIKAQKPPSKRKWHKPFQNEVHNIIHEGEMSKEQLVRLMNQVQTKINFIARYGKQSKTAIASLTLASVMQDDSRLDPYQAIQYLKEVFCIACEKLAPELQANLSDPFDLTTKFIISTCISFKSKNTNENTSHMLLNALLNYLAIDCASYGKEAVKSRVMSVAKEIVDSLSQSAHVADSDKPARGRPKKLVLKNDQLKDLLKKS